MQEPYKQMKVNGKKYRVHRWVMEQHLGRPLKPCEIVHHKNGNKHDNRLENLELMTHQEHSIEHLQKHPIDKWCVICGRVFTPEKTKRARKQTCSIDCKCKLISKTLRTRSKPGQRSKSLQECEG